jgi:hypothetical protein
MQLPEPPKIAAVEVVPAQPTEADRAAIAHMGMKEPKAVYVVKVRLKAKLPVTSMAWALYVGDERVSKYWEYKDGIYFVVFDPQFFVMHNHERLRFSQNDTDFFDTDVELALAPSVAESNAIKLPLQADVLQADVLQADVLKPGVRGTPARD